MTSTLPETSLQRPYLLRAMHEWMIDNNLTPHIVIDVALADNRIPLEFAKEGKLVINVSYSATQHLHIGNDEVILDARFSGVSRHVEVPVVAIVGIYARETGQGMIFSSEETQGSQPTTDGLTEVQLDNRDLADAAAPKAEADSVAAKDQATAGKSKKPTLTIVK